MSKYARILENLDRNPNQWITYRYNTRKQARRVSNGVVSVARPRFGKIESHITPVPEGWLVQIKRFEESDD